LRPAPVYENRRHEIFAGDFGAPELSVPLPVFYLFKRRYKRPLLPNDFQAAVARAELQGGFKKIRASFKAQELFGGIRGAVGEPLEGMRRGERGGQ